MTNKTDPPLAGESVLRLFGYARGRSSFYHEKRISGRIRENIADQADAVSSLIAVFLPWFYYSKIVLSRQVIFLFFMKISDIHRTGRFCLYNPTNNIQDVITKNAVKLSFPQFSEQILRLFLLCIRIIVRWKKL